MSPVGQARSPRCSRTAAGTLDAVAIGQRLAPAFAARAAVHDAEASFPADDLADLRDAGLCGLLVPERLGGMGAGFADYVRVAMALAQGSGATALVFNMHASVTGALAGIPDELARALGAPPSFFSARDRVLRAAVDGALYGVAITEAEAGSRLSALRATYRRTSDGGYHLRGDKSVCSGAGRLDGYLVAARDATVPDAADPPPISYFLVPAGDGLVADDSWDPLGMRATASNGLRLDVRVPADALVGGIEGLALPLAYAMPQWLVASYAAVYVGVAEATVAEAVRYLSARAVAGSLGGLTRLAAVRARLGRVDARVAAARLALEEAARRVDAAAGEPETNRWVYRSKLLAGEAATEAASSLTEACGLGAVRRGAPLERLYRDARSAAIMPPSSDVAADVLGTAALGLDPVSGSDVRPW
jgi:alkylation response protein AidB-like acyl-CoA dehydrogenase